jgi:hypothetical protein
LVYFIRVRGPQQWLVPDNADRYRAVPADEARDILANKTGAAEDSTSVVTTPDDVGTDEPDSALDAPPGDDADTGAEEAEVEAGAGSGAPDASASTGPPGNAGER